MADPIDVTFQPTVDEGARVIRQHLLNSHAILASLIGFPAISGAMTWWMMGSRSAALGSMLTVAAALFVSVVWLRPRHAARAIHDAGTQRYRIDDSGLRYGHELAGTVERPWSEWARAVSYDDLLVLYRTDARCIFLPRRAFRAGDFERATHLIMEHVPTQSRR